VDAPVSDAGWASSFSLSPASALGDTVILVGGFQTGTTSTYGSGQILLVDTGSNTVPGGISIACKAGIAPTTVVSYTLNTIKHHHELRCYSLCAPPRSYTCVASLYYRF
jgi:hypothetical protein